MIAKVLAFFSGKRTTLKSGDTLLVPAIQGHDQAALLINPGGAIGAGHSLLLRGGDSGVGNNGGTSELLGGDGDVIGGIARIEGGTGGTTAGRVVIGDIAPKVEVGIFNAFGNAGAGLGLFWDAKHLCDRTFSGIATTVDATVTTAAVYNPATEDPFISLGCYKVRTFVSAMKDDGTQGAGYEISATFRYSGGVVTQVGTTQIVSQQEDDPAWHATLDTNGTLIRVRVNGVAATTVLWIARSMMAVLGFSN